MKYLDLQKEWSNFASKMGFRFNKTFKKYADPLTEFLDNNPKFKYRQNKEEMGMKAAFREQNAVKLGSSIGWWKFIALVAGPVLGYVGFSVFNYADPDRLKKIKEKEERAKELEKSALET